MPRRILGIVFAAGALALAAPAAAGAATVGVSGFGPTLWYQATSGSTNDLTVDYDAANDNYVFTDPGEASMSVGTGCTQTGPDQVTCAASGLRWVYVTLGDMDDHATLNGMGPAAPIVDGDAGNDVLTGGPAFEQLDGGAGDDVIDGGGGADRLDGGDGDDQISARDGTSDQILCGAGTDSVIADASDYEDGTCESVDLPAPPPASEPEPQPAPQPAPPSDPPAQPAPAQPVLAPTAEELLAGPAPVKLDGDVQEVAVRVSCPADRVGGCEGSLSVSLVGKPTAVTSARGARRGRAPLVKLATKKIKVAAGRSKTVKAHLSRRGRSLLAPTTTVANAKTKTKSKSGSSARRRVTAMRAQVRINVSLRQPDGSLQTSSHDVSIRIPVKRTAPSKPKAKPKPQRKPARKPNKPKHQPKPLSPLSGLKNLL